MTGRMNSAPRTPMYLKMRDTTKACSRNAEQVHPGLHAAAIVPMSARRSVARPAARSPRRFRRDHRVQHEAAERVDQVEDERPASRSGAGSGSAQHQLEAAGAAAVDAARPSTAARGIARAPSRLLAPVAPRSSGRPARSRPAAAISISAIRTDAAEDDRRQRRRRPRAPSDGADADEREQPLAALGAVEVVGERPELRDRHHVEDADPEDRRRSRSERRQCRAA